MGKKTYRLLEEHIIKMFETDRLFNYYGKLCEVIEAGKPRPQGGEGECKTDVFVRSKVQATAEEVVLKISVKNWNKEFLENKLREETMEVYLGPDWESVLIEASSSIKDSFENRPLIYPSGSGNIRPNSITVGWKLEIADEERALSAPIPLNDKQIKDYIYKGTNLTEPKRDSIVNGRVVPNSGIADYLLTTSIENIKSSNDIIEQMQLIDDLHIGNTYFIFTANNYRTDVQRADGPRYLAVRIEWDIVDGKMVPKFHYDQPLHFTGQNDMAPLVRRALQYLGKLNAADLEPGVDVDEHLIKNK